MAHPDWAGADFSVSNKVVPQADTLSLNEDRVYFLQRHSMTDIFRQKDAPEAQMAAYMRQR